MSILINGMNMPKEGFVEILIRDDGTVQQTGQSYRIEGTDYYAPYIGETPAMYEAIPVPPHGRLIDADAVSLEGGPYEYDEWCKWALEQYQDAPTIIPAEEGE